MSRTRAPFRSGAIAILGLAIVSVLSFPSPGGARATEPFAVHAAMLTPDGTDGYTFAATGRSVESVAPAENVSGNLRTVFWAADARPQRDALTCATWSRASNDLAQQGAALRIATSSTGTGTARAVTVTKNVFPVGTWIFNVHVWDNRNGRMRGLATVDLHAALSVSGDTEDATPVARPLPWRLCARVAGSALEFKAWRTEETEPAWGDPDHGTTVRLPADAPARGYAGWYIGHLRPGTSAVFTDMSTSGSFPGHSAGADASSAAR